MVCTRHADCESDEKCQHGVCVVRSGGRCVHHLNCPKLEICTKKGVCKKMPCDGDGDCLKGKNKNSELMCHPEKFCTGKNTRNSFEITTTNPSLSLRWKTNIFISYHSISKHTRTLFLAFLRQKQQRKTKIWACWLCQKYFTKTYRFPFTFSKKN